jgi:hypothetical protein
MKKIFLPTMVLVAGMAFSAFTNHKKAALANEAWFVYVSGDPSDQDSYSYSSTDPGCSSATSLCAVRAEIDQSTIMNNDITTSKPVESGTQVQSLQVLSNESDQFSHPSDNVEFKE